MSERLCLGERSARRVERGFCKGASARSWTGRPVDPRRKQARKWCAAGALFAAEENPLSFLRARTWIEGKIHEKLPTWNDRPERTAAEVITLLRTLPRREFP